MGASVHHFGLTVRDLDASSAWYCEHLGFIDRGRSEISGEGISAQTGVGGTVVKTALLVGSNTILELLEYASPESDSPAPECWAVGAAHVCVTVEDIEDVIARMTESGVRFHSQPSQLVPGTKMIYVRDPDGIMVELIEPSKELRLESLLDLDR